MAYLLHADLRGTGRLTQRIRVTTSRLMRRPLSSLPSNKGEGAQGSWKTGHRCGVLVAEEREGASFSSLSHRLRDSPPLPPCLCSWTSSKWNFLSRLLAARRPLLVCVEPGKQVLLRQQCWGWGGGGVAASTEDGMLGLGADRGHGGPGPRREGLLLPRLPPHTLRGLTGNHLKAREQRNFSPSLGKPPASLAQAGFLLQHSGHRSSLVVLLLSFPSVLPS